MKRAIAVLFATWIGVVAVHAADVKVEAVMARDKNSEPTDTFAPNVPKLYAFFKTEGSSKGDKLRGAWIAEDIGDAAPENTTIDEATLTADKDNFYGAFSLSKPTKGWPEGKYRVEIYVGDKLATSVNFTIKKGGKTEDSEESSSED
jgi:hypothetical protein